jgi:hypothetical protein
MSRALATNFTGSVPKELLKRAKIVAAKMDTSINALFNFQLNYLVDTFEQSEQNINDNYHALFEFSIGKIDYRQVMDRLAIDSEEDLFLLMVQAHLPMPRLSSERTEAMVEELQLLNQQNKKDVD